MSLELFLKVRLDVCNSLILEKMARVFISYRRSDSAPASGRIHDHLAQAIGKNNVFKDVDNIAPGEVFSDKICNYIDQSDAVIVVIGNDWLSATAPDSSRRLDNESDWVRIEVARALEKKKRVIPVLVDGARMPKSDALPPNLKELAKLHAASLRNGRDFSTDIEGLRRIVSPWHKRKAPKAVFLSSFIGICLGLVFLPKGNVNDDAPPPEKPKGVEISKAAWLTPSVSDNRELPMLDVVLMNYTGSPFVLSEYEIVIENFTESRSAVLPPRTGLVENLDIVDVTFPKGDGTIKEYLKDPVNVMPGDPMRLQFRFSSQIDNVPVSPQQFGSYSFSVKFPKGETSILIGKFSLK
jgi:hypothetical protein